ncbi:hypothetical protein HMPREF3293_01800 [Christensenella minuta]|uniref:Uncharacterized protein n=1 Tax=Christensenella minuta TaxID=626937 RepID=A0A136Q3H2_9FIRM|nr:hypothetical protein HMPREF3293_01800 [Christensenella minuta]
MPRDKKSAPFAAVHSILSANITAPLIRLTAGLGIDKIIRW